MLSFNATQMLGVVHSQPTITEQTVYRYFMNGMDDQERGDFEQRVRSIVSERAAVLTGVHGPIQSRAHARL